MNETVQEHPYQAGKNVSETNVEPSAEFFEKLVGLSEAVAITGRNKGRISLDTTGGKLPYVLNSKGQRQYKVADLFQIYGLKNPNKTVSIELSKPSETSTETLIELALLKQQVQTQAEQLRRADDEIRDLRQNRDRLIEQNNRLTMLLPPPPIASESTSSQTDPKPFWKRFFS